MKQKFTLLAGALMITASLLGSNPADAHPSKGKMPADHKNGCATVTVTGKMALLKAMPSMSARTYRTAKKGEQFSIVMDGGRAHLWDGWWLVKAANGYRYWAHQSVLSCK